MLEIDFDKEFRVIFGPGFAPRGRFFLRESYFPAKLASAAVSLG